MCPPNFTNISYKKEGPADELARKLHKIFYSSPQLQGLYEPSQFMVDEMKHAFKTRWDEIASLAHKLHDAMKEKTYWVYSCEPIKAASSTEAMEIAWHRAAANPDRKITSVVDTKPWTYK